MGNPLSAYAGSVLFSFVGVLAFVTCVLGGMWLHRLYTTRGFHLSEFAALRSQAARLVQETASVWQDVARDSSTDLSVKILHMARVEAADDVDCEIRAALNAWEDIMQPGEGDALALDEEDGVGGGKLDRRGEKRMRAKRKSHGRYVIGLMREKCRAAIERRRDLSQGLQIMQLEVLSREMSQESRGAVELHQPSPSERKSTDDPEDNNSGFPSSSLNRHLAPVPRVSDVKHDASPPSAASPTAHAPELAPPPRSASCPAPDDEPEGLARQEHAFLSAQFAVTPPRHSPLLSRSHSRVDPAFRRQLPACRAERSPPCSRFPRVARAYAMRCDATRAREREFVAAREASRCSTEPSKQHRVNKAHTSGNQLYCVTAVTPPTKVEAQTGEPAQPLKANDEGHCTPPLGSTWTVLEVVCPSELATVRRTRRISGSALTCLDWSTSKRAP
ncbi:unnamed protein product [Diplocarpon coronariae]